MTNRQYTARVDAGDYPQDPVVPLDEPFINGNGAISNLLLEKFTSVALIRSRQGAVRANHYHKTDWHYAYVLSGALEYRWRPVGSRERPDTRIFSAGQMFFTPPMMEHAMCFTKKSLVMTFAKNIRDAEHHEEDVVRVPLMVSSWDDEQGRYQFRVDRKAMEP